VFLSSSTWTQWKKLDQEWITSVDSFWTSLEVSPLTHENFRYTMISCRRDKMKDKLKARMVEMEDTDYLIIEHEMYISNGTSTLSMFLWLWYFALPSTQCDWPKSCHAPVLVLPGHALNMCTIPKASAWESAVCRF